MSRPVTKSSPEKASITENLMHREMYLNSLLTCLRMLKASEEGAKVYSYDSEAGRPIWKDIEGKFFVLTDEYATYQTGTNSTLPTLYMAFSLNSHLHHLQVLTPEKTDKGTPAGHWNTLEANSFAS